VAVLRVLVVPLLFKVLLAVLVVGLLLVLPVAQEIPHPYLHHKEITVETVTQMVLNTEAVEVVAHLLLEAMEAGQKVEMEAQEPHHLFLAVR
jgi:DNA-directed RNA polymerase subunit L